MTVIVAGNRIRNPSSNPEQDCVSLCANSLKKGMNTSVLLQLWVNSREYSVVYSRKGN